MTEAKTNISNTPTPPQMRGGGFFVLFVHISFIICTNNGDGYREKH